MRSRWNRHPRLGIFSAIVALLFGTAMVFGQGLNSVGEIPVRSFLSWCALLFVSGGSFVLLFMLMTDIRDGKLHFPQDGIAERKVVDLSGRRGNARRFLSVWLLFMLCWLPAFLAVYPGFFLYDAYDEYTQVATGVYTTHHPLLHVLLLGKLVCKMYELTGAYNVGIALYTLLQMAFVSACFVCVLQMLERNGIKRIYRRIIFLYFAFFPNIVMFNLCSTKDTLFAAALLLTVLFHMEWQRREMIPLRETKFFVPLVCFQVLALLLRNNAVYAFAVFAVILLIAGRGKRMQTAVVCSVTLCCYLLCSGVLAAALHAEPGGKQEILTVPIQQISRAYRADRSMLSEQEKEVLFSYLPENAIERYVPKLSDPVKIHFNNEQYRRDKASFWQLWLKLFTHNPIGYANAWFMTSYGYWYPDADVDVYRGNSVFTHDYENSSYFGFETEQPGERSSKLPFLEEYFREISLDDTAQNIPGFSWMFSMGTIWWIYVLCGCILVAKKQYGRLIPYVFPALVWLTLLLGPTYLPRYVVFIWYLLPLMAAETMMPCEHENNVRLSESR